MLPKILCAVSFLAGCSLVSLGLAQDRMPPIPPDQYSEEQTKAAAEFLAARKVPVFGPFEPLMRSPEVMSRARHGRLSALQLRDREYAERTRHSRDSA